MTTPEDRLRDALAAVASLVQPEDHGNRSDEQVDRLPLDQLPHRWGHRYIPLATAAAVLAIIVVGVLIRPVRDHGRQATPASRTAAPARYFIANVQGTGVSVRDVRTGRVTAIVKAPPGESWSSLSATTDPHMFYIATQSNGMNLHRLIIDDTGRVRSLLPVAGPILPGGFDVVSLAASPDGTRLAFPINRLGDIAKPKIVERKGAYGSVSIGVLAMSLKRSVVFQTMTVTGRVSGLSWAADGRHLAYELDGSVNGSDGVWILDTDAGHDLIAASRHVFSWQSAFVPPYTAPVLSADGVHLYLLADSEGLRGKFTQIIEVDTRTGRRQRMLYEQAQSPGGGNAQWAFTQVARDPAGTSLLAVDDRGRAHRVDIGTGRVTTFPFTGGSPNALAW
jgi:hypothetical protein